MNVEPCGTEQRPCPGRGGHWGPGAASQLPGLGAATVSWEEAASSAFPQEICLGKPALIPETPGMEWTLGDGGVFPLPKRHQGGKTVRVGATFTVQNICHDGYSPGIKTVSVALVTLLKPFLSPKVYVPLRQLCASSVPPGDPHGRSSCPCSCVQGISLATGWV